MNYEFPTIEHIDDVLPIVKDRKDFIVADKGDYKVVNYVVTSDDTFPPVVTYHVNLESFDIDFLSQDPLWGYVKVENHEAMILRECRGIIFDKSGKLISRRLHKFFNVGEKPETLEHVIDIKQPHVILEKLDGSMATPLWLNDHFRLATKMGITEVSMSAEVFVARHPHYYKFFEHCRQNNVTPIFEYCSDRHQIVVSHPVDRLVLIAVRDTITGTYHSYDSMIELGGQFNIEVVRTYPGSVDSMKSLISSVKEETEGEGWIIRFDNGHMVKMKNDAYLRMHRAIDNLRFERNLVDIILNNNLDDIKGRLPDHKRDRVIKYEKSFWNDFNRTEEDLLTEFRLYESQYEDKASFAKSKSNDLSKFRKMVMFELWKGRTIREILIDHMLFYIHTNTKFDAIKPNIIPNANWNGMFDE